MLLGRPGGSVVKNPPVNARDAREELVLLYYKVLTLPVKCYLKVDLS